MSIICGDVTDYLEELAPLYLAEEWDNSGLQLGRKGDSVKRILVSLDVTSQTVIEAIDKKADLIVSHHPMIFKGLKRITGDDKKGDAIYNLIQNGIAVYSAHTNLDRADEGLNRYLAELLGLKGIRDLREDQSGLGKIGLLEQPVSLENFISLVKEKLKVDFIKLIGKTQGAIKKAAVFCGSFDGDFSGILEQKADILVTGDIKYHTALDAAEMGLCILDAGHFGTEAIIVPRLAELLSIKFPEIEVISNSMETDPIKIT